MAARRPAIPIILFMTRWSRLKAPSSFRGDAKHRTRNLEIPRCAIAHLRSGAHAPSRNDAVSSPDNHVSQHETRPARAADAVAEIIRRGARVGADPHQIECAGTAAAHHRAQQAWVL